MCATQLVDSSFRAPHLPDAARTRLCLERKILRSIRDVIGSKMPSIKAVVIGGDFNTNHDQACSRLKEHSISSQMVHPFLRSQTAPGSSRRRSNLRATTVRSALVQRTECRQQCNRQSDAHQPFTRCCDRVYHATGNVIERKSTRAIFKEF
jgi:hypothetical protein